MEKIQLYIKQWNKIDGIKPQNDPEFIKEFMLFVDGTEGDHWEFSGENGYCGFTAVVCETPLYLYGRGLSFEFAYGNDFVKVFTANHHGFWVPEYINLKGDEALPLLSILRKKLTQWGGF